MIVDLQVSSMGCPRYLDIVLKRVINLLMMHSKCTSKVASTRRWEYNMYAHCEIYDDQSYCNPSVTDSVVLSSKLMMSSAIEITV